MRNTQSSRPLRPLATFATFALALVGASVAVRFALSYDAFGLGKDAMAGRFASLEQAQALDERASYALWTWVGTIVLAAVAFSMWTYRAARNAKFLGAENYTVSPGWAVGYYYVPIVSLWRPYQLITETWKASDPDGSNDYGVWSSTRVPGWILAWWLTWIASGVLDRLAAKQLRQVNSVDSFVGAHQFNMVSLGVEAISLALCICFVWSLTRRQDARRVPSARVTDAS